MVYVYKKKNQWKNTTEKSSVTLTEINSSVQDLLPFMIITSDMPWEKPISITSETDVIQTIG